MKSLKIELQDNASSVESDLGWDNHGVLWLVKTEEGHAETKNTEDFIGPTYPGPLVIPAIAIDVEEFHAKNPHADTRMSCLECKNL